MAIKTICPIRDIKGWHNYNKCPYTKSLFSKAGVSDVLYTSGRKERFFAALQKNVGRDGHLTKDAMKKTLGEFKHELDHESFYKLSAAVLPNEKQRFSMEKGELATPAFDDKKCPVMANKNMAPAAAMKNGRGTGTICPVRQSHFQTATEPREKSIPEESSFFQAMRTTIRKNR